MTARKLAIAVAAMALVVAGCKGRGNLSVSARAGSAAEATDGGSTTGSLDLGQGIFVSRARIVVQKIALEGTLAAPGAPHASSLMVVAGSRGAADRGDDDEGEDEGEEDEVKVGPFLIDLSGDQMRGGIVHVFDGDVPAGTFNEIKIVVAPVPADAGANTGIAAMNGASVIINGTIAEGTVDGGTTGAGAIVRPFSFVSSLRAAQKHETKMTVTVNGTTKNVTLTIDPTGWFKAVGGSRLDPTVAANAPAIEANIKASINAFEDEDEDGEDDAEEHGGGHDHGGGHH
jgi:hypothetical protein